MGLWLWIILAALLFGERQRTYSDYSVHTSMTPSLFWYKQEMGDFPKYMWKSYAGSSENALGISEDRFNVTINGKSVPLKIQKLQLTDSAVYYCALRPTVTGNTQLCTKTLERRQHNTPQHPLEGMSLLPMTAEVFDDRELFDSSFEHQTKLYSQN
uniref:Immunoglobulin V-set domain-containing protein n=1 Tax=Labrus bergylta TaxID=56723 RepID=A0A3Q3FGW0_9LABR